MRNFVRIVLLLFLSQLLFIPSIKAQENVSEVFIDVQPPSFSFIKTPGSSEKIVSDVRANKSKIVTQAFDWNKRSKSLDFNYSTWFRPARQNLDLKPATPATHSYSLNTPKNTEVGQYYKLMTYAQKPYSCEENLDSAVMVGVPLDLLIIDGLNANGTFPTLEDLRKTHRAQLVVTGFKSFFSILTQDQHFSFSVRNDGNLKAYFSGFIAVKNQAGETIEKIPFDNGTYPLEKNQLHEITVEFNQSKQLIGTFTAELYLGYQDVLTEYPPVKIDQLTVTLVGALVVINFLKAYGLFLALFLFLRWLTRRFLRQKLRVHLLTFYLLLLAIIPASIYSFNRYLATDNIQGEMTTGPETVAINAVVRESTAIKVSLVNGTKLVKIMNQNSRKGWELWSFNCSSTRLLATDQTFKDVINPEFSIDEKASKLPLLLIPRFFK